MNRAMAPLVVALLSLLTACAKKPPVLVPAPTGQWIAAFNGKNLDDWTVKIAGHELNDNYRNTFRVEDGLLKVSYDQYEKFGGRFGSIFYNKRLSHYWLRAEYRFVGKQVAGAPSWAYENSGIQIHSQPPETMLKTQEFPVSVEFDIVGGRLLGRHPTGDVCENGTRVKIGGAVLEDKCSKLSGIVIPGDQWVTILAEVQGGARVRQIVGGVLAVEYTDLVLDEKNADAGRLLRSGADRALTAGYLSIQSNSHPIEFRRIEILPVD
jgi:3-keto-disaccharide hydrolase